MGSGFGTATEATSELLNFCFSPCRFLCAGKDDFFVFSDLPKWFLKLNCLTGPIWPRD